MTRGLTTMEQQDSLALGICFRSLHPGNVILTSSGERDWIDSEAILKGRSA